MTTTYKLTYDYRPVPVDLPNDSCAAALGGVNYLLQSFGHNAWNDYLWTAVSCSSDPVVVGTTFTITQSNGIRSTNWSPVVSIEKIESPASSASGISSVSDVNVFGALVILGVFFAFFFGFKSGKEFVK